MRLSTYGNDPDRMSAGLALSQLRLAVEGGVLYQDGGWCTLVDRLRSRAEESGVRIHRGARVTGIERTETGVTGIRLVDGRRDVRAVVVAASPGVLDGLLGRDPALSCHAWVRDLIPVRAACLDVALDSLPRPDTTFLLGIDRPTYLSVHSAYADLAPGAHGQGGAVIQLVTYQRSGEESDPAEIEAELERSLDLAQPGWRERVVERRFLPAMVVTHALAGAGSGGLAGRPGPRIPGVPRGVGGRRLGGPPGLARRCQPGQRRDRRLGRRPHPGGRPTRSSPRDAILGPDDRGGPGPHHRGHVPRARALPVGARLPHAGHPGRRRRARPGHLRPGPRAAAGRPQPPAPPLAHPRRHEPGSRSAPVAEATGLRRQTGSRARSRRRWTATAAGSTRRSTRRSSRPRATTSWRASPSPSCWPWRPSRPTSAPCSSSATCSTTR